MGAFTSVAAGSDLFLLSILNELRRGVRERVLVSEGPISSFDDIPAGADVQDYAFWRSMQSRLETLAARTQSEWDVIGGSPWLDHTAAWGLNQASFPLMTLSLLRSISGLSSGFRRAEAWDPSTDDWTDYADDMFSYGLMQPGDIIGPWIIVDLQAAIAALRWTILSVHDIADYEAREGYSGYQSTCADAVTAQASAWSAAITPLEYWYACGASLSSGWTATGYRQRRKAKFDQPGMDDLTVAMDIYGLMDDWGATWADLDSLGATAGQWHRFLQVLAPGTPTRPIISDWLTSVTSNPFPSSSLVCPVTGSYLITASDLQAVCKWQFSNP